MTQQTTIFDDIFIPVDRDTNRLLLNKVRKPLKANISRGVVEIYDEVEGVFAQVRTLLPYVRDFELITTKARLAQYLEKIKENGVVALDTETDGLDPISDRIAGFSIYTEGENPAYIPVNHDYFDSNIEVALGTAFMEALNHFNIKVIMHNSRFDIRVILNWFNVRLKCYFDTLIAAKLLNENEEENSLKYLWTRYIIDKPVAYFKYNDLFSGIKFTVFDPVRVRVYPGLDALMTYELFKFQHKFLDKENPLCAQQDLLDTSDLMFNVEMPVIDVAVDMEERGVSLDKARAKELEIRYTKDASRLQMEVQSALQKCMPIIKANIGADDLGKLSDPINIDSPSQLSIVLFKGLKMYIPNGKLKGKPGSVNAEALDYLVTAYPDYEHIISKILEYKALTKIISTYLISLPNAVNPKTNRLHTSWNTIGADTGRFSSREPNLQNIPSKNKEIRPIFVPKDGYVFVGADYSAQEPRILAEISQDPILLDNYHKNLDLYATLSSMAYRLPYDQCTKATKEGKVRRDHGKKLQLALSYGMRAKSLGIELGISTEDAQVMYDAFTENLSVAFEYGDKVRRECKRDGYVKTLWGRKRRFPDYTLPEYQIDGMGVDDFFNPVPEPSQEKKRAWVQRIKKAYFRDRDDVIDEIQRHNHVVVTDNTWKIRLCETQILNSINQGSAADMTKAALILVNNDPEMVRMDALPVLVVHDEIIVEAPREFAEEVKTRLADLMVQAAYQKIKTVPFKAEGEVMERWSKD